MKGCEAASDGGLCFMSKRVIVYVDGFNLYYRALKGHQCNWLDLRALSLKLLPGYDLTGIKYFTALVNPNGHDPDQQIRQQTYLRALSTLPDLKIIFGSFLTAERKMPEALAWRSGKYVPVTVIKTEEKGSDVNLASHMLMDGFRDRYDIAALMSNDTDLVEPLRMIRQELGKDIALLSPSEHPSAKLMKYATTIRRIRKSLLKDCQFSPLLMDSVGTFHKPAPW